MPLSKSGDGSVFFEGFDKMAHAAFFFILTVFIFYGKIKQQNSYNYRTLTIAKIFFVTGLLGAFIEFLQYQFFTYRSAEWWDFICDMMGVIGGIFSYLLLHRSSYQARMVKFGKMKGFRLLIILVVLSVLGGCGIFKKGCDCPKFGHIKSGIHTVKQS